MQQNKLKLNTTSTIGISNKPMTWTRPFCTGITKTEDFVISHFLVACELYRIIIIRIIRTNCMPNHKIQFTIRSYVFVSYHFTVFRSILKYLKVYKGRFLSIAKGLL